MKKAILFLVCASHFAFAQDENFDQYNYNLKTINPAFAGLENEQNFDFQYLTDSESSTTKSILIDYSNKISKMNSGVGLIFSSEQRGFLTNTKASLLYNYQFKLSERSKISVGTELKYKKQHFDYSGLVIVDPDDPIIIGNSSSSNVDLDFGALYQIMDFYAGVSSTNLLQSNYSNGDGWLAPNARTYNFYFMNEFKFAKWLKFTPSLMYKTSFKGNSILDINSIFELEKCIILGATIRVEESDLFGIYNAGINIKDKVQVVGTFYNGAKRQRYYGNLIEIMVSIKISNE